MLGSAFEIGIEQSGFALTQGSFASLCKTRSDCISYLSLANGAVLNFLNVAT